MRSLNWFFPIFSRFVFHRMTHSNLPILKNTLCFVKYFVKNIRKRYVLFKADNFCVKHLPAYEYVFYVLTKQFKPLKCLFLFKINNNCLVHIKRNIHKLDTDVHQTFSSCKNCLCKWTELILRVRMCFSSAGFTIFIKTQNFKTF